MRIETELQGMDELVKALEQCATEAEIRELNKNIVTKAQPIIKSEMASRMPKSKDVSKSGRGFGTKSSVSAHAMDEIPMGKPKTKGTAVTAEVGWEKNTQDEGGHFYVRFLNWGTIYRPPKEFIYKTGRAVEGQIQNIAEREYQSYLDKTVR